VCEEMRREMREKLFKEAFEKERVQRELAQAI